MILVENKRIDDIPLLHLIHEGKEHHKLPFVMFVHGFGSVKEKNLHYAYLLAKKGFRVVLPEALFHGEREAGLNEHELEFHFWEIVLNTIKELKMIKEHFEREDKIDTERIGVAGTSMGGLVTLGALTAYPWIKAAVSLMGMPYYEKFANHQIEELKKSGARLPISEEELQNLMDHIKQYDLSRQPEKLDGRPLLFWHGKNDKVVPYSYTYQFYKTIKPLYEKHPEKLQFITDEKADHKVSLEGVFGLVDWFEKYISLSNVTYVTPMKECK